MTYDTEGNIVTWYDVSQDLLGRMENTYMTSFLLLFFNQEFHRIQNKNIHPIIISFITGKISTYLITTTQTKKFVFLITFF